MAVNEIFWINSDRIPGLAIVLRPRGDDWLKDELLRMKRAGIATVVSLLERDEAEILGLAKESSIAVQSGLEYLSYPIPDRCIPEDLVSFQSFVSGLANRLRTGARIGIHCRGSIGRATITASCTLIHLGWNPSDALTAIEAARGCTVPDTPEQKVWILRYEPRS
jgi:protein-tyrosine phosphatase